MLEQMIFNFVFLSQALLMSWYFPSKVSQRMSHVMECCPPSTHPRLYPKPLDYYEAKQRTFRIMNALILIAGLAALVALVSVPHETDLGNTVAFVYYLLQIVPLVWLDLSLRSELRLMRSLDTRSIRTAELNPRRLFDVMSPALFWSVIVVYVLFWVFTTYMRQFEYPWFGGYMNNFIITGMNLWLALTLAWFMYGKKLNPHQSHEDRLRVARVMAKVAAFISIALTTYAAISILINAADARGLSPIVKSIYFQVIGVATYMSYRIDSMNFDVYKEDPVAT